MSSAPSARPGPAGRTLPAAPRRRAARRAAVVLPCALGWLLLAAPGCRPPPRAEGAGILVHAAASLTDVLAEAGEIRARETGQRVRVNAGASNQVARQVAAGAPGDILFTADDASMDAAQRAGAVDPATRRVLLSNRLVVVVRADAPFRVAAVGDLAAEAVRRVAIADPAAVPAGAYARERLQRAGVWDAIAPKLLPVENVRAAVAAVAAGSAAAGLAYRTDVSASPELRIACDIPELGAPRIQYPVAVMTRSADPGAAAAFIDFLGAPVARAIFEKHGFVVIEDGAVAAP